MNWVSHTLGSISLLFTGPATSTYFVEGSANPPEEELNDEYVTLNDGAGARLSHFAVGKAPFSLDVICLGTTQADADAARDALQAEIDAAMNGAVKTYAYQQDASQPGATSWRIVGGRVRPRWRMSDGSRIFGLGGRAVSLARVQLVLSKS